MKKLLFMSLMISITQSSFTISNFEKSNRYYNKGVALLNAKKYSAALSQFNAAIELNPNNSNIWDRRGTVHLCMKNYPSAIRDYTRAINLAPQVGLYYTGRALAYSAMGNINAMKKDILVAAYYGEPEAKKIVAAWEAAINAQRAASYSKNIQKTNASIEKRFGFKPGTLKNYQ